MIIKFNFITLILLIGFPCFGSSISKGDTNVRFDEARNIYSNFKYSVSFDAPDYWEADFGLSKHTIFRANDADTGTTFSINVIEMNNYMPGVNLPEGTTMWDIYQKTKTITDSLFRENLKNAYNLEIWNLSREKAFISNHVAMKSSYKYIQKESDIEYEVTTIQYQVLRKNRIYTFTLGIASMFYNQNSDYYNQLFNKVRFLFDVSDQ